MYKRMNNDDYFSQSISSIVTVKAERSNQLGAPSKLNDQRANSSNSDDNISDYELVTNDNEEDDGDDEKASAAYKSFESDCDFDSGYEKIAEHFSTRSMHHHRPVSVAEQFNFDKINAIDEKLRVCLTAEKIALHNRNRNYRFFGDDEQNSNEGRRERRERCERQHPSSSTNINSGASGCGGNDPSTNRNRYYQVPSFTIVPIDFSRNFQDESEKLNLPEIVLTSFESQPSASSAVDKSRRFVAGAATTAVKSCQTPPSSLQLMHFASQICNESVAPLQPPPAFSAPFQVNNDADDDDDDDDLEADEPATSQPWSPSPESYVDNMLSAASSVSIRSSDASEGGGTAGGMAHFSGDCSLNSSPIVQRHAVQPMLPHQESNQQKVQQPVPLLPLSMQLKKLSSQINSEQSSSPATNSVTGSDQAASSVMDIPGELKCHICQDVYKDPRTLNCLHSFCFQCLVDENFKQDSSMPFCWQPDRPKDCDSKSSTKSSCSRKSSAESSPEFSYRNGGSSSVSTPPARPESRSSLASFRRKKSIDKLFSKSKSTDQSPQRTTCNIFCKICKFCTELPTGGMRQLPQHFILMRKIEDLEMKLDEEIISKVWCSLCYIEASATYHCVTCTLNLCTFCKEAHERQRTTTSHKIKNIMELRKLRKLKNNLSGDSNQKLPVKCAVHPGFEIKSFCNTCLQIACADCLVLLHKGHKHEPIAKAFLHYQKILRESTDQMKSLPEYAEHSIGRLNDIAKQINRKCDKIQEEVEAFMRSYTEAVEVHRTTLLQQIHRARESKVDMILEQQLEMGKRSSEAIQAVKFGQELTECSSEAELLSFVNILLKRYEFCQKFKPPVDPKISDTLHFLPQIRAPSTKNQNNIPLFGIITTQIVKPQLCTLESEGFTQLRLHRKIELVVLTRDADGVPLCHGGLVVNAQVKYKEGSGKFLPIEVADRRDGTYGISFVPDSQGTMLLSVIINDKHIKGSPYTFIARTVRPHSGIYHCCAFCSSKGSKLAKCSCEGRMPGYNGCGHGHAGHPGRRHWSCCGNVLENSECTEANKLLNS